VDPGSKFDGSSSDWLFSQIASYLFNFNFKPLISLDCSFIVFNNDFFSDSSCLIRSFRTKQSNVFDVKLLLLLLFDSVLNGI